MGHSPGNTFFFFLNISHKNFLKFHELLRFLSHMLGFCFQRNELWAEVVQEEQSCLLEPHVQASL